MILTVPVGTEPRLATLTTDSAAPYVRPPQMNLNYSARINLDPSQDHDKCGRAQQFYVNSIPWPSVGRQAT